MTRFLPLIVILLGVSLFAGCASAPEQPAEPVAPPVTKPQVAEVAPPPPVEVKAPEPVVEVIPREEPAPAVAAPIPAEPVSEPVAEPVPVPAIVTPPATAVVPPVAGVPAAAPASRGAQHFVVTLAQKDASHPAYGKGHPLGFAVNGVQGKELVVERGKTYEFEIVTDPKHDVYLSSTAIGWGGGAVTHGVSGAYIYQGTMTFAPDASTPDDIYYACRNHPFMGGRIHVVDPGAAPVAKGTNGLRDAQAVAVPETMAISEAQVKQRLMFADMMLVSQNAKRVEASTIDDAKAMLVQARNLLPTARERLAAADTVAAMAAVDESLRLFGVASRMVPSDQEVATLKARHEELLKLMSDYETSYANSVKRLTKAGSTSVKDYDRTLVTRLKSEAQEAASKNDYAKANRLLEQAEHEVAEAITALLQNQTVVFELNFETPADEYEYELRRYASYEELIPIAIREKQPAEGVVKLMNDFVAQGQAKKGDAARKAGEKDFETAIAMLKFATMDIQRALRLAGVSQ